MQSLKEGAQRAVEVVEVGTSKAAAVLSGGAGQEADPEHHVESKAAAPADSDLGGAAWRQAPGPLEKMRESAAHAVEGVKLRLHLGSAGATAEQRTGEALHMAKAAEGRNEARDDPVDHAMHDALKPDPGERPEMSAFPETLGDALAVAQMRDLPANPPSAAAAAAGDSGNGVEPAPPNPFSAGSRSKL